MFNFKQYFDNPYKLVFHVGILVVVVFISCLLAGLIHYEVIESEFNTIKHEYGIYDVKLLENSIYKLDNNNSSQYIETELYTATVINNTIINTIKQNCNSIEQGIVKVHQIWGLHIIFLCDNKTFINSIKNNTDILYDNVIQEMFDHYDKVEKDYFIAIVIILSVFGLACLTSITVSYFKNRSANVSNTSTSIANRSVDLVINDNDTSSSDSFMEQVSLEEDV